MATTATTQLDAAPGLLGLYGRALLPRRGDGTMPPRRLALRDVGIDPARLRRYAATCGFEHCDPLPVTYPHIAAFPLAMALMTRPDFPYPLLGLVHIAGRIDRLRPIGAGERLSYQVWAEPPHPHPKGTAFDVVAEAADTTGPVWRSVSTYLRRGPGGGEPGPQPDTALTGDAIERRWDLPGSTGRAYAAVSGDRNPIHLHPLLARPFGFPRAIAHGMWTTARCLAELGGRLPGACRVRVAFRAPVLLPGQVCFRAARHGEEWEFELRGAQGPREHLRGSVSPLS